MSLHELSGVSYIARLPLELLSIILITTIAVTRLRKRPQTALRISHVSSAWRAMAFATPDLWQDIVLGSKIYSDELVQFQLALLPPSLPLRAVLHGDQGLSLLAQHSLRWKFLHIKTLSRDGYKALDHIKLPSLSVLEIGSLAVSHEVINFQCTAFQSILSLRKVTILDLNTGFLLPWAHLTYLYVANWLLEECFDALCGTHSLVEFHLENCNGSFRSPPTTRASLPALTQLDLALFSSYTNSYDYFFTSLSTPHIKRLTLDLYLWAHAGYLTFFSQMSQSLRSLDLDYNYFNESLLGECLTALPCLEELFLRGWISYSPFEEVLAMMRDGVQDTPPLLPRLTHLMFEHRDDLPSVTWGQLLADLIEARWSRAEKPGTLSKLMLRTVYNHWKPQGLEPLHNLRERGFNVSVVQVRYNHNYRSSEEVEIVPRQAG